jgi:hypothetical protein
MRDADIILAIQQKLAVPVGRHLYGVIGTYPELTRFENTLRQARDANSKPYPKPNSVTDGILDGIPDDTFKSEAGLETKRPEVAFALVHNSFKDFLRKTLTGKGLTVLKDLELLFAYQVDLSELRVRAADRDLVLLLLPGKREVGRVRLFPDQPEGSCALPTNLIPEDHLWVLEKG